MNKSTFQNLAATLFVTAGDIKKSIDFTNIALGAYDPATDITTETVTAVTIDAVVTNYLQSELNDDIKQTDYKVKVLASDVSTLPSIPKLNDEVTIDSVVYTILDVAVDPADAVYTMQVRE